MPRVIRYIVWIAVAVAVVGGLISFRLSGKTPGSFLSDLLLNVVAESLGFLVGIALPLWLASGKLDKLAPRVISIIAQLKADDKIHSQTARDCVVCAAGFLFEDHLGETRERPHVTRQDVTCNVCTLPIEIEGKLSETTRCAHCKLPGKYWKV
jgi:hypothetical protein